MPTIKHGSIVNKTDFCSQDSLKIAGTADFRRKSGISWISRAVLHIFSWNFPHWYKTPIPKIWQSPIFNQCTFPTENAGNMPEKPVFWRLLEISPSVFTDFLFKNVVDSNSQYFVKIAGTADCRAGKVDFLQFLSSLTQYFIHEFLLYSFARSFIRLLVGLFVFSIFFINVYVFSLCLTFIIR